jgi:DNA gyrase inhibitor GyrI
MEKIKSITGGSMSTLDVKIVALPAFTAVSALGFGAGPELEAWDKIFQFLKAGGMWERMETLEYFGFNNPDPMPGSSNYGYEQWVVVPDEIKPTGEVEIKAFPGGLYAVTRCTGLMDIFPTWQKLAAWREDSPYQHGSHQWLEKWVNPSKQGIDENLAVMDLYLPVIK